MTLCKVKQRQEYKHTVRRSEADAKAGSRWREHRREPLAPAFSQAALLPAASDLLGCPVRRIALAERRRLGAGVGRGAAATAGIKKNKT